MDSSKPAVFYIDTDDSLEAGRYEAILIMRYKDGNSDEFVTKEIEIDLNVKKSPRFVIQEVRAGSSTFSDSFSGYIVRQDTVVSPSDISQGGSGQLRITIMNEGEEKAESVSVKIFRDSSHPFEFGEIYDFIGNLDTGQSGDAVFDFTVEQDAVLKEYYIDIEIRYIEDSDVEIVRDTIRLEVAREQANYTFAIIGLLALIVVAGFFFWKKRK